MAPRAPIIAGKTVILLQVQDTVDSALAGVRAKLKKFSASIGTLSLDLFRGGLAGTLPLGFILRDFQEFEDSILFLETKLRTTDTKLQQVIETIRFLGRTTSFTANEIAEAGVALAQAGFNADELQDSLQAVLDLARGGRIPLDAAAAILANTLRVFSLETKKANVVASQFIAAARLGTLDVLDLKESLKETVGTLNVLNIDLPTSLALVTQLAQSSLRGTKAGTSLNTALLNLARNQDVLKNTLDVQVADPAGNLRPFIDIMDELTEKLKNLGNVRRVAVLQRLFNIRGGRAVTGIIRDIERVRQLTEEIRNSGNEAREAAKKMDSEFGGALRFAISAVQDLSLEIGKITTGPLTRFLRTIPSIANAIQELLRVNPQLVITLAAIPPALLAAGVAGLALSFALSKIAGVVGVLGAALGSLGSIINRALTGQLILALQSLNLFQRTARRADRGLSALLLTPQRITRGRTAGKVKPTSFVSRVGNIKLTGTVLLANRLITAISKLIPSLTKLDEITTRTLTGIESISRGLSKLAKSSGALGALTRILGALSLVLSEFLVPGASIGTKFTLLPRAFLTIASNVKQLSFTVSTTLVSAFNKAGAALKSGIANRALYRTAIVLTSTLGDAMNVVTRNINSAAVGIGSFFKGDQRFILSLSNFIANLRGGASRGDPFRVIAGSLNRLFSLFKATRVASLAARIFNALRGGIFRFISAVRLLTLIDLPRLFLNLFRNIGNIAKGFFVAANAVRRFVFSFSGILTIAELLIIFGPRIEFIRKAFERLGRGISGAFAEITSIFDHLPTSFRLLGEGFRSLAAGRGTLGLEQIGQALTGIVDIVGIKLAAAWHKLTFAIAPAYDFIRRILLSTIEIFKLFGSIFGATFKGITTGFAEISGGGTTGIAGAVLQGIRESLSPEALKSVFSAIGAFLVGAGRTILNLIERIFTLISSTAATIHTFLAGIADLLSRAFKALGTTFTGARLFGSGNLKDIGTFLDAFAKGLQKSADESVETRNSIKTSFTDLSNNLDDAFGRFLKALDNIFKSSLESNSLEAQNLRAVDALASHIAQRQAADRAEEIRTAPDDLAARTGQAIAAGISKGLSTGKGLIASIRDLFTGGNPLADLFKFGADIFGRLRDQAAQTQPTPDQLIEQEQERLRILNQQSAAGRKAIQEERDRFKEFQEGIAKGLPGFTADLFKNEGISGLFRGFGALEDILAGRRRDRDKNIEDEQAALRRNKQEADAIKDRIRQLRLQASLPARRQVGDIREIVSASVGSVQQFRQLKFKAAEAPAERTNDLLEQISGQLGPGAQQDSYLKQLLNKTGAPVFTQ